MNNVLELLTALFVLALVLVFVAAVFGWLLALTLPVVFVGQIVLAVLLVCVGALCWLARRVPMPRWQDRRKEGEAEQRSQGWSPEVIDGGRVGH